MDKPNKDNKTLILVLDKRKKEREYTHSILTEAGYNAFGLSLAESKEEIEKLIRFASPQLIMIRIIDDRDIEAYQQLVTSSVLEGITVVLTSYHTEILSPVFEKIKESKRPFLRMPYLPIQLLSFIEEVLKKK
jgi:DNA-binding NtrC family response regulator